MTKIDIMERVTDEQIADFGMTKEEFENSRARFLMEAMLMSTHDAVEETTLRLMREKSLSYAEAKAIAVEMTRRTAEEMMRSGMK